MTKSEKPFKKQTKQQPQKPDPNVEFIVLIYDDVMTVSKHSGFSWLFMLAQSALETRWGRGVIKGSNNIFNVKADKSYKGKTVFVEEAEEHRINAAGKKETYYERSYFRAYESYTESIRDWLKFLEGQKRFRGEGKRADGKQFINIFSPEIKGDLEKLAYALEHDGYATDKDGYANKIIEVARCRTMRKALAEVQKRKMQKSMAQVTFGAVPQRNNDPASIYNRWPWDSNTYDDGIAGRWDKMMP
jgi:flagellum-specific peptidoglycan hydrolase FlgJ